MKLTELISLLVDEQNNPNSKRAPIKINLVTHAGRFHSDEVTATAILELFLDQFGIEYEVIRCYFPAKSGFTDDTPNCIVYDIGLGIYDHHQTGDAAAHCARIDADGTIGKYAAVGLIWKEIGPFMFPNMWEEIYNLFIKEIDDHDNGKESSQFSRMIAVFNPAPSGSPSSEDRKFFEVEASIKVLFKRIFENYKELADQYKVIEFGLSFNDDDYVATENYLYTFKDYPAARKYCRDHYIPFYIYPSSRTGYCFETIQVAPGNMRDHLKDIPDEVRNWEGVNFLHASCFLGAADTKELAIEIVETICRDF